MPEVPPVPADCDDRSPPTSLPAPLPPIVAPDVPIAGDMLPVLLLGDMVPDPVPPVPAEVVPKPEVPPPAAVPDVPYPVPVPDRPVPLSLMPACPAPVRVCPAPDMLPVMERAWLPDSPIVPWDRDELPG